MSVWYFEGDSRSIAPDWPVAAALVRPAASGYCLDEMDLLVFSGTDGTWTGQASSSTGWCEAQWLYPWGPGAADGGIDGDCADGTIQKLFLNAMEHELGHLLGLDHQPSHLDSIVNESCDGCDQWTIGATDQTCLTELYDACR